MCNLVAVLATALHVSLQLILSDYRLFPFGVRIRTTRSQDQILHDSCDTGIFCIVPFKQQAQASLGNSAGEQNTQAVNIL